MDEATTSQVPPAPALGGVRELILFLLAALLLYILVPLGALIPILYRAHAQDPALAWPVLLRRVEQGIRYDAFFLVPVQLVYFAALVLLLYALVHYRRGLAFWPALAVRRLAHREILTVIAGGVLLAIVAAVANERFPAPEELPFDKLLSSRPAALLVVGSSLFVAPLVEELVFRGYIYTLLEGLSGRTPAVIASGLMFGVVHFPQLWPGYVQMGLLCLVGVAFSLARARTGNTLASVLAHFTYNAVISSFFLASREFSDLPLARPWWP